MSDNFLTELKLKTSLIDLIGRDLKLTRKGRDALGLCPFHREKTPSFNVVEDKQFYHCFGCGAHGDAISWLTERHQLSFKDAVQQLADNIGITIPAQFFGQKQQQKQSQDLYHVASLAADYFHQKLLTGAQSDIARDYLTKRDIDDKMIARFYLGFAPNNQGFNEFMQYMQARDVTDTQLEQVGLIAYGEDAQGNKQTHAYARFRNRLIFPIYDMRGRVIAFGGRTLQNDNAKYINSPETILFHKGAELYHYDKAIQAIKKGEYLIVAEGYMDVLRLVQYGFHGAVAPLGTALTEQQIAQLWRLSAEPILCFDGDEAGKAAGLRVALRALPLLQPGKSLLYCFMPQGHDPDSFLQDYGAAELQNYLSRAMPLGEMLFHHSIQQWTLRTPETRAGLEQQLMGYAASIQNQILSKHYKRFFSNMIWESLRGKSKTNPLINPLANMGSASHQNMSILYKLFQNLVLIFIHHPALYQQYEEKMAHYAELADANELFTQLRLYLDDDENSGEHQQDKKSSDIGQNTMPLLFALYHQQSDSMIDAHKGDESMISHYCDEFDYFLLKQDLKHSKLSADKRAILREQLFAVEQRLFNRQLQDK
ncbi:MAG: DNA primase [Alphaproteobacteria bacterium]|nr:DNA primase [Alphaproteobacteria bacterium]